MIAAVILLLAAAAPAPQFEITDARGKQTSSIRIEAGAPNGDGWFALRAVAKGKGDPVMVWPLEGLAKAPDGPEPIAAIVIQRGDERALANKRAVAAMVVPIMLGTSTVEEVAARAGLPTPELAKAFTSLASASGAFEKGLGLLYMNKPAEAAESLAAALKERQRQLTRVPSEIYPAALIYGQALARENKFDDAAVAFLVAMGQRPSSELARKFRTDALIKAGKGEAAEQ